MPRRAHPQEQRALFGMSVPVCRHTRPDAAKKDLIKQVLSDAKDRLEAALT